MMLDIRSDGSVRIVTLTGKLDLDHAPRLRAAVLDALQSGFRCVILDLESVSSIDSSGLGTLVSCRVSTESRGGTLVLLRPSPRVRDVLDITGVEHLFSVAGSLETALDRCRERENPGSEGEGASR